MPTVAVREIMTTKVVTIRPDQSLATAAAVLADNGIGAAPVLDESGTVVGLLRDEDLLISEARLHLPTTIAILPGIEFTLPGEAKRYDAELKRAISSTVGGVMEREFPRISPDGSLEDLATLMHRRDVTHVTVLDDGVIVGIATRGDIVRHLAETT